MQAINTQWLTSIKVDKNYIYGVEGHNKTGQHSIHINSPMSDLVYAYPKNQSVETLVQICNSIRDIPNIYYK